MTSLLLLPDAVFKGFMVIVIIVAYIRREALKRWWRE